jgi:hypothetical protein
MPIATQQLARRLCGRTMHGRVADYGLSRAYPVVTHCHHLYRGRNFSCRASASMRRHAMSNHYIGSGPGRTIRARLPAPWPSGAARSSHCPAVGGGQHQGRQPQASAVILPEQPKREGAEDQCQPRAIKKRQSGCHTGKEAGAESPPISVGCFDAYKVVTHCHHLYGRPNFSCRASASMRRHAMSNHCPFFSIPKNQRRRNRPATPVVPDPMNGNGGSLITASVAGTPLTSRQSPSQSVAFPMCSKSWVKTG